MAKMSAFREKDLNLVGARLDDRLVDLEEARRRLGTVPDQHNAASWLASS